MTINPLFVGIFSTLFVEMAIVFGIVLVSFIKGSLKR